MFILQQVDRTRPKTHAEFLDLEFFLLDMGRFVDLAHKIRGIRLLGYEIPLQVSRH